MLGILALCGSSLRVGDVWTVGAGLAVDSESPLASAMGRNAISEIGAVRLNRWSRRFRRFRRAACSGTLVLSKNQIPMQVRDVIVNSISIRTFSSHFLRIAI